MGNSCLADSTGSVCISIKRPGQKTKHIFLTILTSHVGDKITISCQMISELNDANMIAYWLREFIKSGGRKPDRMITDQGKSLRSGICSSMNNLTFKQYNQVCLLILQGKVPNFLDTQMSSDISHLMNVPKRWPNFMKMKPKVQQLYEHWMGILSSIDELEHFETFFKADITLASSKTFNSDCTRALRFIINLIKTFHFDIISDSNKNYEPQENETTHTAEENQQEEDEDEDGDVLVKKYVNDLAISIGLQNLSENEFLPVNEYHYPEFAKKFTELCYEFPCCTNIMLKTFGLQEKVATPSRSENVFRDTKDTCLNSRMPVRPDEFILLFVRTLNRT